ncbi:bifunctional diaminohydroxyphosphoribosylaminopyrimidine deaminase/5-amino-6-(5-phosphoribosylamino)uracil reductase RibD [Deefgea piscis]|uniref:bifunctional diaminohydroxyphosphoribosylaminopyrimidine deaminase/5-amino-6-(5-phosphoribosylamino)uracil reductase RibD n=1 Tax=Deefgea piscis TaxID=2739061 RepID=UPI001C7EBCA7|nr:bifunctional diaminohydroxyphosphoribosylaminopyrimidine deaminase/5-amino-6-(5-phosphoribosylamino)uracil reductase RibD [Deefgea piscis]QZA79781.1 bifunctional diaminohydroxyphosphoribosylaminopyrimidine deaminase/5-amino-6-(5-phosphoribosylamino)uracil reductase RibD [Deefgea piscis]
MAWRSIDYLMMAQALHQAKLGQNNTSPNPSVGCVLTKNDQIISMGHTQAAGGAHAEVMALRAAGSAAQGATAYVTLEPCSHFGKTPPCANALIAAGVTRVIAALLDPNPLVSGQGLQRLAEHGIVVEHGLMAAEALTHHQGFFSRMIRQRPWLRCKVAASLDGQIALSNGQSQWITGPAARADVQRIRARSCAMITGIATILHDDPQLNVRDFPVERQPIKVILDSQMRTPVSAKILQQGQVLIVAAQETERRLALEAAGAEVILCPDQSGVRIDLAALCDVLAVRGCNEVTLEAGGTLVGAFFAAGLIDELWLYQAPVLLGQGQAMAQFCLSDLSQKQVPTHIARRMVGDDQRIILRFTDPATEWLGK